MISINRGREQKEIYRSRGAGCHISHATRLTSDAPFMYMLHVSSNRRPQPYEPTTLGCTTPQMTPTSMLGNLPVIIQSKSPHAPPHLTVPTSFDVKHGHKNHQLQIPSPNTVPVTASATSVASIASNNVGEGRDCLGLPANACHKEQQPTPQTRYVLPIRLSTTTVQYRTKEDYTNKVHSQGR